MGLFHVEPTLSLSHSWTGSPSSHTSTPCPTHLLPLNAATWLAQCRHLPPSVLPLSTHTASLVHDASLSCITSLNRLRLWASLAAPLPPIRDAFLSFIFLPQPPPPPPSATTSPSRTAGVTFDFFTEGATLISSPRNPCHRSASSLWNSTHRRRQARGSPICRSTVPTSRAMMTKQLATTVSPVSIPLAHRTLWECRTSMQDEGLAGRHGVH